MVSTLRRLSTLGFLAVALSGSAGTARANALPVGATTPIIAASLQIRGTAVAYDSTNHVFLVVAGDEFIVWGRFVAASGAPLGEFVVKQSSTYKGFPGVAFSPDANGGAGGFLVAWHEFDLGFSNSVHAIMAAYGQGGVYGVEHVVNTDGTYQSRTPAMAYSPANKEFLVALALRPAYGVRAVRVDNNATPIAASFSIAVNNQYEDYPSAAYNPVTNQFLVSYSSSVGGMAFVYTQLVQAGANQLIRTPTLLYSTVGTFITSTAYNPKTNQFLVAFVAGAVQSQQMSFGRLVNFDASVGGPVNLLSSRWAASDGMSVDYNPVTGTYFLIASTPLGAEDGGVEITGAGIPVDNGFWVTSGAGGCGRAHPFIKASTQNPNWLITTTNCFAHADIQLVSGKPRGHGNGDLTVWRPGNGTWYTDPAASGYAASSQVEHTWGEAGDIPLTADIDGDGIADLVIWRPSNGMWYWLTSSSGFTFAGQTQWGNQSLGDVPMLADIDGDGKADLIVWRASTGTWYWLTSSSGYAAAGAKQWGNQSLGDVPKLGDMDGDGKADLIVWRGSTGTWYWLTSSSGYNYAAAGSKQWGNQSLGDVPLVGDLDGDGNADLVVWRGSTGTWFWLTSSSGYQYSSQGQVQWGNQSMGDVPLLTDMDGDGKADLIVWRASTGWWYWLKSTQKYALSAPGMVQWGGPGDIPVVYW
jgi:hypothetical protein